MTSNSISIVYVSHNVNQFPLEKWLSNFLTEPLVSEILVVDDNSETPVSISKFPVIRNPYTMGLSASKRIGLLNVKSPVVLYVDNHCVFKSSNWGAKIVNEVLNNPKNIVCPSCLAHCESSFHGKLYGGSLDILENRRGYPVVFESRWNKNMPDNGIVECAMGETYALATDWHRKIDSFYGIKGYDLMGSIALSVKTRLSGGKIVVLNLEAEQSFPRTTSTNNPIASLYNKLRLAYVVFPPEIATTIPTILGGSVGVKEACNDFIKDFSDIVLEKDRFWEVCHASQKAASDKAGIKFNFIM